MATTPKPPKLDRQVKALIDHMSLEQVEAIRAPRGEPKSFADELIREIQAKAQARLDEAKAGPLPDEPNFNEETMQVLRDAREGEGLVRYDDWDDLFADLGIEAAPEDEASEADRDHEARVRAASESAMGRHGEAFEKLAK